MEEEQNHYNESRTKIFRSKTNLIIFINLDFVFKNLKTKLI